MKISRPAFNAVMKHSKRKPVIVFVPSRKQTRITAIDLLTFAASENTPDCFLHADAEDIESFVNKVRSCTRMHGCKCHDFVLVLLVHRRLSFNSFSNLSPRWPTRH